MTDKEQIMIDGCNVSGCENYRPKDRFTCYPYICNCHQKPNCYYKQLVRKTQECEELKKGLDLYKTWYRAKHGDVKNTLGRYRKALEEIKKVITPLANKNPVYNCWELLNKCDGCRSKKDCGTQSPYHVAKQILDIINRVKEEE